MKTDVVDAATSAVVAHSHGSNFQHSLTTKYYTAKLTLTTAHLGQTPLLLTPATVEGYILLPSAHAEHHSITHPVYEFSSSSQVADAELKLLVLLKRTAASASAPAGAPAAPNEHEIRKASYVLWAIDHGFEFIEIDEARLVEGA